MTYSEFVSALAGITVDGVNKRYDYPPSQLSTAVMPAMYPRLPESRTEVVAFDGSAGVKACACELVIVVNPGAQSRNDANFGTTVDLMDALDDALRTAAEDADTDFIDKWSMRLTVEPIGEVLYWLIVARVEGSR